MLIFSFHKQCFIKPKSSDGSTQQNAEPCRNAPMARGYEKHCRNIWVNSEFLAN